MNFNNNKNFKISLYEKLNILKNYYVEEITIEILSDSKSEIILKSNLFGIKIYLNIIKIIYFSSTFLLCNFVFLFFYFSIISIFVCHLKKFKNDLETYDLLYLL